MKIVNKRKFVARILEVTVLVGTIILTPIAIKYTTEIRGYGAYGGEYLIPVLGIAIAMIIETIYEESKNIKRGEKHEKIK